jgi:predicted DNA helicase
MEALSRSLILPTVDAEERERLLRRLGIPGDRIVRTLEADGKSLLLLADRRPSLPASYVPTEAEYRKIRFLHDYVEEWIGLIEKEREAEREARMEEIRRLSGRELEGMGRAILGVRGRRAGREFELHVVRFGRQKPLETEIGSGDLVWISRGNPLQGETTGTVMRTGRNFIDVAFVEPPPRWMLREGIRIDLAVNDTTFRRMEENLRRMLRSDGDFAALRDKVLGLSPCAPPVPGIDPEIPGLNPGQSGAVAAALECRDLMLIHGPPGTGKTTTLVALILEALQRGERLLATADSNVAVDNLLERLARREGIDLVRLGHPARIGKGLEPFALSERLRADPSYGEIERLERELESALERRARHTKPTPARMRGMSRERIATLAETGRGMRGVSPETILSMAAWIAEDRKVRQQIERLRELEAQIIRRILESADVVLATNSMVGSEAMEGVLFDRAVIDEGSQQMEPSTLLPLLRAPRAVIAGDHRQLPPTVVSEESRLRRSLFERLMERKDVPSRMLRRQYRMHPRIMEFPNRLMYGGLLEAAPETAERRLPLRRWRSDLLDPARPALFVDLPGSERRAPRSHSYENPVEAEMIGSWTAELVEEGGVDPGQIGVITPYLAQARRIRRLLEERGIDGVEVRSVDGFQGREKEVILLSFVRANPEGNIGFVADARRLNVAMTRARSKLIMVGSRETLEPHEPFGRLFDWLRSEGSLLSAEALRTS